LLKSFRYFLFPFSIIYGAVLFIRNKFFDKGILRSAVFNFPVICVGNLAVGGTGKTPMTEYIVQQLKPFYKIATLSRGYKRRTKGFAIANEQTTAIDIGDEPMQFFQKFPDITVAVGEERIIAIPQILHQKPETEVIVLDDAFQHRSVSAGFNILLTDYSNLYTRDLMFPAGDLRDIRKSAARADVIIVTKCESTLSLNEKNKIIIELNPLPHQRVFFTTIDYSTPYHLVNKKSMKIESTHDVILLCGIANPIPIKKYLNEQVRYYEMMKYPDHHIFASDELVDIKNKFENVVSNNKIVLTTEKDAVRLEKFEKELSDFPIFVLPIKHHFLFEESTLFNDLLIKYINSYSKVNNHA